MNYHISLSRNFEEVKLLINKRKISSTFISDLSKEFKKELNLPQNTLIIMTGHQPIIYYPGIFTKLIVAHLIAQSLGGKAYYLVLDTDQELIDWKFIWYEDNQFIKKNFTLSDRKKILLNQTINNNKKNLLIQQLNEWQLQLYHIFEPSLVLEIKKIIEFVLETLNKNDLKVSELSIIINEYLMKCYQMSVEPIYVSTVSKTKVYKEIFNFIKSHDKLFRNIYNEKLNEFRKKNNIKNIHYPFSNLLEGELPFWKSDGYRRQTLSINDDSYEYLFPKAITLSMCIRMFLSDFMIHGTGGGIYDLVSEEILKEFFMEEPSPYMIATSTIPLKPKADIPLFYEPSYNINYKLRKWKFNPEQFLKEECILRKKKIFLIHLKNKFDSLYYKFSKNTNYDEDILNNIKLKDFYKELLHQIEKEPEKYGEFIHHEFIKLNHKMHLYTIKEKKILLEQYNKSKIVETHQRIFFDRTYPVFYYDIINLKSQIQEKFFYNK